MTIVDRPGIDEIDPSSGVDAGGPACAVPEARRRRGRGRAPDAPTTDLGAGPTAVATSQAATDAVAPRRWLRRTAAALAVAAVAATLVTLRLEVGHARARLDEARTRAAGTSATAHATDAQLTAAAGALTTEEAAAVVAASDVAAARARLAETDVTEEALHDVLDDTQRRLDETIAEQRAAAARARELEQLRPELAGCLADALRVLSVTALPSVVGPPPPPAACAALERARAEGPGR